MAKITDGSKPKGKILEVRQLELSQMHMLGSDIDIYRNELNLVLNGKLLGNISDAVTDASVSRTIDGASTLTISIFDRDLLLLRSGRLNQKLDLKLDGIWWRFRGFSLTGYDMELKFEEREIAILRTYSDIIPPISRGDITRAEFVLKMLSDVKEFKIPYYIPELHKNQPVDQSKDLNSIDYGNVQKEPGINKDTSGLTVKDQKASAEQVKNANIILKTGDGMIPDAYPRKRKILVCGIMTPIVESELINLDHGDRDSKGLFQQRPSQGWEDTLDPVREATQFFDHAIKIDTQQPHLSYNDLCQKVQGSATPDEYGKRRTEGEKFVNAYGISGGDSVDNSQNSSNNNQDPTAQGGDPTISPIDNYFFYRGKSPTQGQVGIQPENTWECIQRLAEEVNRRAFFISGRFYWIDESYLMRQQPVAVLTRESDGVISIDISDYDQNKKVASVDITCQMGRFDCPPGSVIMLEGMGPANGRWLVETVDRGLFDPQGTINLKKKDPILPEPATGSVPSQFGQNQFDPSVAGDITGGGSGSVPDTQAQTPVDDHPLKALANRILDAYDASPQEFRDDDAGRVISQWRKLADGQVLDGPCGDKIVPNVKIAQTILYLIDNGYFIGCSAFCEDHTCYVAGSNPPRVSAHANGLASDFDSIGKPDIGWKYVKHEDPITHQWIKEVMTLLLDVNPSQIICNGNGSYQKDIQKLQWNGGQHVDYITTGHTDHIHVGF
jgi:hypothetical protein